MKISAILLAAGLSRRMGRDKLLLKYNGKSLLQLAVDLLTELPVYERIIVGTQAGTVLLCSTENTREPSPSVFPLVLINPNPKDGQSGSVRIGVGAATGTHFLFLNADQPKLTKEDLLPMLEAAGDNPDKIIFPVINGEPCSPTIFPERFRTNLLDLQGDNGGRVVRDAFPEHNQTVKPENPINFTDIDTWEDFNDLV